MELTAEEHELLRQALDKKLWSLKHVGLPDHDHRVAPYLALRERFKKDVHTEHWDGLRDELTEIVQRAFPADYHDGDHLVDCEVCSPVVEEILAALRRDRMKAELDAVLAHDREAVRQLNAAEADLEKAYARVKELSKKEDQQFRRAETLQAILDRVQADAIEQQKQTGVTQDYWKLGVYAQASRTRTIIRDALAAAKTPGDAEEATDG